jgi:outer membrane protein
MSARVRVVVLLLIIAVRPASAQTVTLDQAMQYALDHYPTVRAALEQVHASAARVDVAHAAYLPRLDTIWQSNRATANNIFGQLLPQSVIPAMSGPVLVSTSAESVWGSAAGALLSWDAVDFGLRRASIAGADAALTRARAGETLTRLDVQSAVGAAFLEALAAQRAITAAQADVDRRDVLGRMIHTLVDNELRPGADASRADAERAAAQTRLIRAQQTRTVAQAMLVRLLGVTAGRVTIAGDGLLEHLPGVDVTGGAAVSHPLAQVQQAVVDQARAFEQVLARTDLPHVYLQSSVFARGSGANAAGPFEGGAAGLGPDRANWAAGVQVVFPNVFDFSSLRARKAAATATTRAETARLEEAVLTVTSQQQTAAALLQAARAVAANTPIQLAAARSSETQARARYDAGLTSVVDVADAQSLLAQAEIQDELARVDVWRALLAAAVAQGDVTPFLNLVRQP